ncbi:uncharacterized protein K452DRAFT_294657 [Aplosporella prunicola CBS 121167]|uniref:Histidine kinase n=1 Tax=Aplosporella prunicola CBS 121167 TaxID=1176127 RepID=A0A6A6BPP3_9PEZI|nr:uncharacterized protein K452DRAFT_294657 [Aplosporella prunicola CBS 121167]KAF2146046.1 hypothetical protein K452DRAFT_294657 [Aplosporella prunicola CBS 121167]
MLASIWSRDDAQRPQQSDKEERDQWYSVFGHGSPKDEAGAGLSCARPTDMFSDVPLTEYLDLDQKPTFVVDLCAAVPDASTPPATTKAAEQPLPIVYQNQFLRESSKLLAIVAGVENTDPHDHPAWVTYSLFRSWILDHGTRERGLRKISPSISYGGYKWGISTLRQRWKIVHGVPTRHGVDAPGSYSSLHWANGKTCVEENNGQDGMPNLDRRQSNPPPVSPVPAVPGTSTSYIQCPIANVPRYDWTLTPPPPNISSHIQLARNVDWASTPLGPMENWSPLLRFLCNFVMVCPNPAILFWGPDLNMIYNDAYPPLVGDKHPSLLGSPPWVGFAEAWDGFQPFFRSCEETGTGAMVENMLLFLNRGKGIQEETYYSFSFTPIMIEDKIVAWYETVFETTNQKITERRMSSLLSFGELLSRSQDTKSFWQHVIRGLDTNQHDVPFTILYSVSDHLSFGLSGHNVTTTRRFELEGSTGVPEGHPALATRIDISLGREGFTPFFKEAAESEEPILLSLENGRLPAVLIHGIDSPIWNEPCNSVVICAIRPTTGHCSTRNTTLGFLVIGLNSHRPYDEDYRTFIRLIRRQVTTSMASVLLLEEETRRGRTIAEQAAFDQEKVEEQLRDRTRELEQSELQLKHFADAVPTGIFVIEFTPENMAGSYRYRNEKWYELTGDSREDTASWKSPLWQRMHPEDVPSVQRAWKMLIESKTEISFEFRVPRSFRKPSPVDDDYPFTWILCYAFSVVTEDGWLRSIVGSVTDVTAVRWAEGIQKKRMEDALEAKRQQENFIDVTSHEMRNPLSAIMISADDIITSLRALDRTAPDFLGQVDSSIDAAKTVLHCAQHQRRIIDDVLTISKLDSGLFTIIPVEMQPTSLVKDLKKMFGGELNAANISSNTIIDDSFKNLNVDWVLLDSMRLQQILINLVTNSIKFTQYEAKRQITVRLSASKERPKESPEGIQYLDFRKPREDLTLRTKDWGEGEQFYIHFSVKDTGCGLTVDEKKLLFMRFSQAPRTMVHYGGSGLGLFICRELCELQGGSIGVESEAGKGSTFAFYVKVRRVIPKMSVELPHRHSLPPESTALHQSQNIEQTFEQPQIRRLDLNAPSLYDEARSESPASVSTQLSVSTPNTSLPSPRTFDILIVEDNKINQQVMSKGLVKLGHTVSIANHGGEAIEFLMRTRWWHDNPRGQNLTVVLMDVEMPVMDGLTCVRSIREMEKEGKLISSVNVIAITANARIEQVNTALEAGMDDVVSKPFRVAELTASIDRLLDAKDQNAC